MATGPRGRFEETISRVFTITFGETEGQAEIQGEAERFQADLVTGAVVGVD